MLCVLRHIYKVDKCAFCNTFYPSHEIRNAQDTAVLKFYKWHVSVGVSSATSKDLGV
jgi:hypothetical protein